MSDFCNNGMRKSQKKSTKNIVDHLATALELEDKFLDTTYKDYLQRQRWPEHLREEDFNRIRGYLNILL